MPQLSGRPRKLVRATHIAFSVGWLGLVVAMCWGKTRLGRRAAADRRRAVTTRRAGAAPGPAA